MIILGIAATADIAADGVVLAPGAIINCDDLFRSIFGMSVKLVACCRWSLTAIACSRDMRDRRRGRAQGQLLLAGVSGAFACRQPGYFGSYGRAQPDQFAAKSALSHS